jgi:hypothetical protein
MLVISLDEISYTVVAIGAGIVAAGLNLDYYHLCLSCIVAFFFLYFCSFQKNWLSVFFHKELKATLGISLQDILHMRISFFGQAF